MDERLVAIGIIVWNGEECLSKTLDSLLSQTYRNFKIIILDNQSTDKTHEILRNYNSLDSRISFIIDEKRRDIAGAQKFIFDKYLAKYEFCMFSCDDDLYHPEYISTIMEGHLNSSLSLIYTNFLYFNDLNEYSQSRNIPKYLKENNSVKNARNFLVMRNCIPIFFGIYRSKSLFQSMKHFRMVDFYGFNHENLMLIHFLLNNRVDYIDKKYFFYRNKERVELYKTRGYTFSTSSIKKYLYALIHNYNLTLALYSIFANSQITRFERLSFYLLLPITYVHRTIYAWVIYPPLRRTQIYFLETLVRIKHSIFS